MPNKIHKAIISINEIVPRMKEKIHLLEVAFLC